VAQIGDSTHLESKLRMTTGGRLRIDSFRRGISEPVWTDDDAIVSDEPLLASLAALGLRTEPGGESPGDAWTLDEIVGMVHAAESAAALAKRSSPFDLALRDSASGR